MDQEPKKPRQHINTNTRGLKHRPQTRQTSGSHKKRPQTRQTTHTDRPATQRKRATQSQTRPRRPAASTGSARVRTTGQGRTHSAHTPRPQTRRNPAARPAQNKRSSQNAHNRQTRPPQNRRPRPAPSQRQPVRPKPKKKPFIARHPKSFAIFILIVAAVIAGFIFFMTRTAPIVFSSDARGISSEAAAEARSHRVKNILLLGTDGRNSSDAGRSDTIMILTADFEHKKLKLTSLLRDTYVEIPDHGMNKLNAAYSIGAQGKTGDDAVAGGAQAAMRAVNRNFDMAITDYVTVDFTCTAKVVDAVGGVTINIKSDAERQQLNKYVSDTASESGGTITADPVTGTGKQHLNGAQALAYSRIRYVGNGDFERTQRQRRVFNQVFKKAKKMSIFKQYNLYKTVKPYIHTTLSGFELFKYLFNVALIRNAGIEQQQIPESSQVSVGMLRGVSYVFPETLETNIETLHQFIYEEAYAASSEAVAISEKIQEAWPY